MSVPLRLKTSLFFIAVENLIKDLNLQIGMDEAKDMLNYFKKYIEQGQLPSKDGIDCYLNIWMSKKRPYFRQCAYAEGRHIIQNLLQACINKSGIVRTA